VDGERSGPPAGQEGGYVPPDLVSTQRFWAIPAAEQGAAGGAQRGGAESNPSNLPNLPNLPDRRVAPAKDVRGARTTQPVANGAMPVPMAAAAPPRLPARAPAGRPWPSPAPAWAPPSAPRGTQAPRPGTASAPGPPARPGQPAQPAQPARPGGRKPRLSRHMLGAAAAAVGVVIIGVGVAALWPGDGGSPVASGDGASSSSSSAPAKTQRGGPSPTGNASAGPAAPAGAQPLTRGRVVSYVTTQRESGYFEGVLTLTNRTGAPLNGWQVSFTYPGAYIKSVWGGVLVHAGSAATIRGTAAAASIPAGATVQVRFGAAGTPSAPVGCTLNGGPC
jgi:hypothetical protein